jgi:GH15 family glucan-1,4-alpha-glucosidase
MPSIEDYALIGDLQTAALVSRQGSIDWCCFPRFDSGACFAALLGDRDNGRWLLAPAMEIRSVERRYRTDTLILESIFETDKGTVRAIDFMPPRGRAPDIVRIVEGLDGSVPMRSELVIRYDFGHIVPWVRRVDHARVATAGPDALCFRTPVEVHGEELRTVSKFELQQGERIPFTLTWFPSHEKIPRAINAEQALTDTENYWLEWAAQSNQRGDYQDEIHQSLRVLKALTYAPTGGIVAAATTSLPEQIGGARNWDYRFCWLRDATLTLLAMLKAGYVEEARAWADWLRRAVAGDPADLQIMYGLAGERRLDEREIEWLPGFQGSTPVRVGNAASEQRQLDVYGEVLDAAYQSSFHRRRTRDDGWSVVTKLLEWLSEHWREEDAGLWEMRGPNRHFTHSKVMCWVAFDRAVRLNEEHGEPGPVDRWRALRDEIRAEVLTRGWNDKKQAFTQYFGSDELDASLLLMPLVRFLPATDERFVSTVEAIRRELTVDGLVLRYRSRADGAVDRLPPGEGVFLPCSFWLANVLSLQGKLDEARELFERLLDLRNDVGLLAEEYDPVAARQLGNFPQAFTHLALVDTAIALSEGRGLRNAHEAPASVAEDA